MRAETLHLCKTLRSLAEHVHLGPTRLPCNRKSLHLLMLRGRHVHAHWLLPCDGCKARLADVHLRGRLHRWLLCILLMLLLLRHGHLLELLHLLRLV